MSGDEQKGEIKVASKTVELKPVELSTVEQELGNVNELDPPAKVRINLAKWILAGVFLLLVGSSYEMLNVADGRLEQAKEIFEFAKSFGPPIVTLVIGFYFRSEGST